ncbi:protein hypothetical protein [Limosa lapponica baueri]|uniref:Uncharacterized protein n=1 Tax=Limosa lapponica baueri TaxID=1758121 RepID=A0A2I0U7E0_LIMLA|nr:protein hypothetical protein [Limosa lapponica baueri]
MTHAEETTLYNKLPEDEKQYALFTDGSCRVVGKRWKWKAAVWSPTQVTETAEGQDGGKCSVGVATAIEADQLAVQSLHMETKPVMVWEEEGGPPLSVTDERLWKVDGKDFSNFLLDFRHLNITFVFHLYKTIYGNFGLRLTGQISNMLKMEMLVVTGIFLFSIPVVFLISGQGDSSLDNDEDEDRTNRNQVNVATTGAESMLNFPIQQTSVDQHEAPEPSRHLRVSASVFPFFPTLYIGQTKLRSYDGTNACSTHFQVVLMYRNSIQIGLKKNEGEPRKYLLEADDNEKHSVEKKLTTENKGKVSANELNNIKRDYREKVMKSGVVLRGKTEQWVKHCSWTLYAVLSVLQVKHITDIAILLPSPGNATQVLVLLKGDGSVCLEDGPHAGQRELFKEPMSRGNLVTSQLFGSVKIFPRDSSLKDKFIKHFTGPVTFSSECSKHFHRLYHNTRDCSTPAYYKRCARLLTRLAMSPLCTQS